MKDLLLPPNSPPTASLDIRHDADGRVSVPGLVKENVTCLEDVMEVFARGSANRFKFLFQSLTKFLGLPRQPT